MSIWHKDIAEADFAFIHLVMTGWGKSLCQCWHLTLVLPDC